MSPLANMLIQIKNAQAAGHDEVLIPFSRLKNEVAKVLKASGFIKNVEKKNKKISKSELPFLAITLSGSINGLRMVSKPSRRLYSGKSDIREVRSGFGTAVITTSKGIMTASEARKMGVGGEIMFEIW